MNTNARSHDKYDQLLDDAEKLIWALLDDRIEADDAVRIEKLLKESEQVRSRYRRCAEVHANLYEQYGKRPRADATALVLNA